MQESKQKVTTFASGYLQCVSSPLICCNLQMTCQTTDPIGWHCFGFKSKSTLFVSVHF